MPIDKPQPIPQGQTLDTFSPWDHGLPDGVYFDPSTGAHQLYISIGAPGGKGGPTPAGIQQSVQAAVTGAQPAPAGQLAASPPAPQPQASAAAQGGPGGSWMDAPEVKPESYPGGGGDPGRQTGMAGVVRGLDTFGRQAANALTFGLADKAEAAGSALPSLLKGDTGEFVRQYSRNLTGQQIRDAADYSEAPAAAIPGMVAGSVVQAVALPELKAASLVGRLGQGAAMGAGLGFLDSSLSARGNVLDLPQDWRNFKQAAKTGAISAGVGSALHGLLGPRLPELSNPQGVASIADHDLAGVQPIAATQGGQSTRQISQMLSATPMGGPLRKAFAAQQQQTGDALDRIASGYGAADNAAEAGGPIVAANGRAVAADKAARASVQSGIGDLAQRYGFVPKRRVAGEDVVSGVQRFAQGDGAVARNAGELPARATSFSQKAGELYNRAFGRLDREMAGKTGSRPVPGDTVAGLPTKATVAGQKVDLSTFGQSAQEAVAAATSKTESLRDRALNVIRAGKRVSPNKGPSLLEFISKNGGVSDPGGELANMDAQLWHREAAFRNKVVHPNGRSLEDMAQLAYDQGYFPERAAPTWDGRENMQALSGQELLDAMRQELAGSKRFAEYDQIAQELAAHVNDVQDLLDHLGIDPRQMNNRQIKAAIDEFMGVPAGSTEARAVRPAGASQIDPAATQAVLKDIFDRNQSPAVQSLLLKPEVRKLADAVHDTTHLSFQDLRDLRTWVREAQDDPKLRQNIGAANLQRLESSLTEDIYANARKLASPGAERELRRSDQFYAAGQKRIQGSLQSFYQARSGEAAFDRILGGASKGGGANIGRLRALQKSLRPEEWGDVASGVIDHMGAGGEGFDLERFVKAFDNLSPEGRDVLFGGRNAGLKRSLDRLVDAGRNTIANPPRPMFGETPNAAFEGLLAAAKARGRSANLDDIRTLKALLSHQEWGDVASGVIRTMGRDGDHVSVAKFVTEWDKLSPGAREALFGGPGREDSARSLDAVVRVMAQMKAAGKLYNHSGSGNHVITALILEKPAEAAMKGEFQDAGAMLGIGFLGNMAARLLANPDFARFAAWGARFKGPFAAIDARLDKVAADNPRLRQDVEDYRTTLRRVRANTPAVAGANAVQRHEQGRVDPRSMPQLAQSRGR